MLSTTDMHVTGNVDSCCNETPEDRDMLCNDDNVINCDDCSLRIRFTNYVLIVCSRLKFLSR